MNILGKNAPVIMNDIDPCEMNESIPGQMAKLFSSLANGNFSKVTIFAEIYCYD